MKIAISAIAFDLSGHIEIDTLPANNNGETTRRVSRVATLDGDVAVNDRGYAEGDRTLVYSWQTVSKAHNASVDRMVRLYSQVNVATPDGVYLAAPESYFDDPTEPSITLLVIEKLTA